MFSDHSSKMSRKIPSQGSNSKKLFTDGFYYEFEFLIGRDKQTFIQKIERWCAKRQPPLNTILLHLFAGFVEWYYGIKVSQTMDQVDAQIREIGERWKAAQEVPKPVYKTEKSEVEGLDTISVSTELPDPWEENYKDDWNAWRSK